MDCSFRIEMASRVQYMAFLVDILKVAEPDALAVGSLGFLAEDYRIEAR